MTTPGLQKTKTNLSPPSALSGTSAETFVKTEKMSNAVEDDDEDTDNEKIPEIVSSLTDDELFPHPFSGQLAHSHASKAFTFNILGKLFNRSSCDKIKKDYFKNPKHFPSGEPLLASLLYHGMTISTKSLGMNPQVMATYFVRIFRKMKEHYFEGLSDEDLEEYKIPGMEGKRYLLPSDFVMLHYPRLNTKNVQLRGIPVEFKTKEEYIPDEEMSDVVDISLQEKYMTKSPRRGEENLTGENPNKEKQGQGKRPLVLTPDSEKGSLAPKKPKTSAGAQTESSNNPKKTDSFQNLSTARMAEILAKKLSQEENKDTKIAKTLDQYKHILWQSEIRAERLYSDYCNLYDALFLSAFHFLKPENESDLEKFFVKYLANKSPQWSSHGGYMTVTPASVSIAQDNTRIESLIKVLNDQRVQLVEAKDLLDLSKIKFPLSKYSSTQKEDIRKLMYSPDKYVSKKSHVKSLGIAEEPIADSDLDVAKALDDYKEGQKDPIDFRQYFPKENETLSRSMAFQM